MASLGYELAQYSPMNTGGRYVDVERQLRAAAAAGFEWYGIDIWSITPYVAAGGRLSELATTADELGLACGQLQSLVIGAPGGSASAIDDLAVAARVLDPSSVHVVVFGDPSEALHPMRAAADRIRAEAPDVVFTLEPVAFAPLASLAGAMDFINVSGIEGFGLNVDFWQFSQGPDDWSALDALTSGEVLHVQLSDRGPNVSSDLQAELKRQLLPGQGELDVERFVTTLRRIGFDGRVGVAVISTDLQGLPPEQVAVAEFDAAHRFWGAA